MTRSLPFPDSTFITRVVLENYKSIEYCDVRLGPLTYLVGPNGSGKSNFLDALRFISDVFRTNLDTAIRDRGGLGQMRRRPRAGRGRPLNVRICLEFNLPTLTGPKRGKYDIKLGSASDGEHKILAEYCELNGAGGQREWLRFSRDKVEWSDDGQSRTSPAIPGDSQLRLYLTRDMFVLWMVLRAIRVHNIDPAQIREPQPPDEGDRLSDSATNLPSVIGRLSRVAPATVARIQEYLQAIVPGLEGFRRRSVGARETLSFTLRTADDPRRPQEFWAPSMSHGTIRALALLVAVFAEVHADITTTRLVGIEEPELGLHPAASGTVRDALEEASESTQIIVTSHSPDLLDSNAIDPNNIRAVTMDHGATRIGPLDDISLSVLRDRLFTAGELLRLNQLTPSSNGSMESAALRAEESAAPSVG
jgi:predicted ATPase